MRTIVHDKGERQLTHVNPGKDSIADSAPRLVGAHYGSTKYHFWTTL